MASSRNRPSPESEWLSGGVAAALERHLPLSASGASAPRLVLGLSGGVDSVVLLHVLVGLRVRHGFELAALHVHHGLSPHADVWARFCAGLCGRWQLPLEVVRRRVPRDSGLGLEAAARAARYHAYAEADADGIVLAHHGDDQAETLLLNLLRGAGVHGAAAMPECRPLRREQDSPPAGTRLLRPLLGVSRADIEAYARHHGLAWIEDESNHDPTFSRNFLRSEVMPRLHSRFPQVQANLSRAAAHFAEAAELLADLAELDLGGGRPDGALSLTLLADLGDARGRNLLRHWLLRCGATLPDARHLGEIRRQLLGSGADAQPVMSLQGEGRPLTLRRFRGLAHVVSEKDTPAELLWGGERELPWAGGRLLFDRGEGGIRADRLDQGPCRLRPRQGGERFQPDARRPRRSLKKLLQESILPPWQRHAIPCLWCGDELVWVAGLGIAVSWQCREGESGWHVSWSG